jgi:hypothetical protein
MKNQKVSNIDLSFKRIQYPFSYISKSFGPECISKSLETRIYTNATLLSAGNWADMISNSYVKYTPEALSKAVWVSNYIDLGHDHNNPLSMVGSIQNIKFLNNSLKGDLYIDTITQNGRDIVSLIDANRINNLSVEMATKDIWDSKEHIKCANDLKMYGVAIVGSFQACLDARIK